MVTAVPSPRLHCGDIDDVTVKQALSLTAAFQPRLYCGHEGEEDILNRQTRRHYGVSLRLHCGHVFANLPVKPSGGHRGVLAAAPSRLQFVSWRRMQFVMSPRSVRRSSIVRARDGSTHHRSSPRLFVGAPLRLASAHDRLVWPDESPRRSRRGSIAAAPTSARLTAPPPASPRPLAAAPLRSALRIYWPVLQDRSPRPIHRGSLRHDPVDGTGDGQRVSATSFATAPFAARSTTSRLTAASGRLHGLSIVTKLQKRSCVDLVL